MQGVKRKLVYVSLYEVIGMTFSALGLALLSGTSKRAAQDHWQ